MADTPADVAATYLQAWRAGDFDTLRTVLADDATFDGPFGQARNADDCVIGLRGLSTVLTDIVVRKTVVDGDDVMTWLDLHTADTEPLPTVNWRHVDNGKITSVRVTFDPRPLTEPGED
jgi:ketosteroid isomerase-like protein